MMSPRKSYIKMTLKKTNMSYPSQKLARLLKWLCLTVSGLKYSFQYGIDAIGVKFTEKNLKPGSYRPKRAGKGFFFQTKIL